MASEFESSDGGHIPDANSSRERNRLRDLEALNILDTAPTPGFDRYRELVRRIFDVPMAFISFVDRDRQWFKSECGLNVPETPRSIAFCSYAIREKVMMVVPDALEDPRFKRNPLVLGPPHIRFYVGCILLGPTGFPVGTMCIADTQPRTLSDPDRELLLHITGMLQDYIALLHELNKSKTTA